VEPRDYLAINDDALLADCDVHIFKASGPGGQHRNKVSSAVRLKHRPTGITASGQESRSQHENRRRALGRLRMNIACRLRSSVGTDPGELPAVLAECLLRPRAAGCANRLDIGRKDPRFWAVAAALLDLLEAHGGRISAVAAQVGVSTGNLVSILKKDRHLLAACQAIRRRHGAGPIR